MDVRKHKAFLKAISIIVVVCFLSLDVAWAYPVSDIPSAGSQKLAGELPFQQDLMSMQRQEFQESLFSDMKLLLSVNSVAKFLLDDDLPLKYLDRVLTEELGEVAEGIDLSKVKISGGVILIPYNTAEKRYILQIARKDDLSARELMGYQWVIGDKYVITALPEDYQESPQTEAKPQKEEPKVEISEPVAEIEYETKVELTREEPSKKKLIIRAIIAASLLILLTPLSAFAGTGAMASTLGALDGTELAFLGIAGALAAFFAFWFWLTRRVTMPASWWLKKLKSDDKMARREAVECLGKWKHYNNEEVINALINALENDDDPGVRARAAKALGVIANKRALDAVTKAKNDKDPLVAIHAERAWHELMDNAKVKEREDYFAPLRKPHKGFGQLLFGVAFLSLVLPLILHLILNDIGTSFFIGVIAALIFIPFGGILLDIKNNVDAIKDFRTEPVEASEPMKFEDKGTPPKGPSLKILIPAGYDGEAYKRSEEKERLRILETLKKEKTGQKDFPGFLTWALAEERSFSKEGMDTSYIQGVILKAIGQETLWHPRDKELYGEVKGVLINLLREEYGSINKLTAEDKLPSNVEYSTVSRFAVQELMRLYLAFEKGLHLSEEEESVLVAESRPALLVLTTLMAKDPPVDAILDLVAAGLVTGWGLKGPEIKEEHDYKAQDGFKAARISAGLYILSVIGALLLLYLNGGNITGGVIGVLAPGLYAGMAAWKYFMVGEHVQVKMEQFLRRNFEGQREGDIIVKAAGMMMNMSLSAEDRKGFYDFISKYQGRDDFKERFIKYLSKKLPVANSDGYRNLVFEELPASVQRAINIHEKFRSHFRGMISLLPVIYLFQKTPGENVKSIFKARAIGLWSSTKEAEENRLGEYDSDEYDADVYVHGKPGEVNWRLAKTAVTSPEELEVAIEILNENISIARDLTAPKGSYYGPNSFKGSVSASINMENVVSLLNDPEKLRGLIPERLQEKRRLQQPQPERPEGINLSGMMFAAVLAMERPWDYSWVNHVNWVLYAQVVAISIFFILSGTFAVVWSDEYESSKNTMIRRIVDRVRFANWYSRADAFLEGNFIVHLVAVLLFAFCMGVIFWLSPVLSLLEIILIKAPTRLFNYTDAHLFRLPRLGHVLALRVKWMGRRKNIKGLIRSLTSRMEPVKKTAISQLAKLGADPKVEKELIEALKAGEPHTAFYLAIVLGRMKSKKAIEPLIEIMENKYGKFYVRHSAAVALGQTDDPKVIDPLLDMLSVEGLSIARLERVRSGVVKALARFDGPIVKPAHKAKVRAYVEKLFNDCTLCDGQHKQSAAKKRFLGDEKKKAIIDGLCKTVHDFKDIEKVEDLLHQVVHVTFHWSRYGSSIRISKSMYEDDLRIKEILDPKNQNIEYGRSGDIMISVTCDMDRLAEIVKEATAREDAAREEAAEGSEEQEGSTHDLGVKDSYNASRITGVLSAVGFATSVAYYYLAQSPVIGIVIGAAAFGLYWGWAAVRYYRVYKTTYEEMRRKLPRAEAFKATIARNDGYRDDFIRKPGFPRKVEDLMNIHESFGSHFWGMIAMLPLVSLF
ncbi:MAG: HEAT repeat domain-containing protein, partial [Candidatus Omnitrophota bacterium]